MVEGARLLSEYTVKNCIVGSNPILSANSTLWPATLSGSLLLAYAVARVFRRPSGSALMARNRVRAGPLGFLAPRSHSCTVRMLNS